jgi:hypothetical protein
VLKASSIPTDVDVFRGLDLPAFVFATERFVDALRGAGVAGFTATEVEVAS